MPRSVINHNKFCLKYLIYASSSRAFNPARNFWLCNTRINWIPEANSSARWVAIWGSLTALHIPVLDRLASTVVAIADRYSSYPKQAAGIWRQTGQQGALSEFYRPSVAVAVRVTRFRSRLLDWPSLRFYTGLLSNCRPHFRLPFRRNNVYSTQFHEAKRNGPNSVPIRRRQEVLPTRRSLFSNLYSITSHMTIIYRLNCLCINSCRRRTANKHARYVWRQTSAAKQLRNAYVCKFYMGVKTRSLPTLK